jgi:Mpv17 / PMP22 family
LHHGRGFILSARELIINMAASFAWRSYSNALNKYPMLTKACTSATLMCTADVLCQQYEIEHAKHIIATMQSQFGLEESQVNLQYGCVTNVSKGNRNTASCEGAIKNVNAATLPNHNQNERQLQYDPIRSMHLAITGFLYSGPISHTWYNVLERIVVSWPRHPYLGLIQRLFYDAFLFSPIAVGGYFIVRSTLEGRDLEGIVTKLQTKWWAATSASWSFWPLANVVNFSFVPIQFRVLYNNSLSLFWNAYLSRLNSQRLQDVVVEQHQRSLVPRDDDDAHHPTHAVCFCSHCRAIRA